MLTLSVLVSSAAAGAFNQYYEKDLDPKMARTKNRPFVTGQIKHGPFWLLVIGVLTVASVGAAWLALARNGSDFMTRKTLNSVGFHLRQAQRILDREPAG